MKQIYIDIDARQDLRDIWQYTVETWGRSQANVYLSKIDQCIQNVARGKADGKQIDGLDRDILLYHCKHHYIFFHILDERLTILAVFHERMDLLKRVKERIL